MFCDKAEDAGIPVYYKDDNAVTEYFSRRTFSVFKQIDHTQAQS